MLTVTKTKVSVKAFAETCLACLQHHAKVVIEKDRLPHACLSATDPIQELTVRQALEHTRDAAGAPRNLQFFNLGNSASVAAGLNLIAKQREADLNGNIGDRAAFYGDLVATFFLALAKPDESPLFEDVHLASPFFAGR